MLRNYKFRRAECCDFRLGPPCRMVGTGENKPVAVKTIESIPDNLMKEGRDHSPGGDTDLTDKQKDKIASNPKIEEKP